MTCHDAQILMPGYLDAELDPPAIERLHEISAPTLVVLGMPAHAVTSEGTRNV